MSRLDGDIPVPESGKTPTADPKIIKVADETRERIEKPSFQIGDRVGEKIIVMRGNQEGGDERNFDHLPCKDGKYYRKLGTVVGFVDEERIAEFHLNSTLLGFPIIRWDQGRKESIDTRFIEKID